MSDSQQPGASIRESIIDVLSRIRRTAQSHTATELPTADFSNAINAVGEQFVDLLLAKERHGKWWLNADGSFQNCHVRRIGVRVPRNFIRGHSPEWEWFPESASRLADPMTGPDHVVRVTVPSLNLSANVVLEQKLRFSTRQDAVADSSTYIKHLLSGLDYPKPGRRGFHHESYCSGLLEAVKAVLCKTKKDGQLAYSGSVPQVCFACIGIPPNKITVADKSDQTRVDCGVVGFLAPTINTAAFAVEDPAHRIIQAAKVGLWIGLDSLLKECEDDEVEAVWSEAIDGLSGNIRNPVWRSNTNT